MTSGVGQKWARAKQSSETRLRKSKSSRNKQLVLVFFGLCFCFAFVPQKGLKTAAAQVKPLCQQERPNPDPPPWHCSPQQLPTTEQAPSLVSRNPSQKKKTTKLPSQLCQVELVLTHYIFNLIIRSFACYCNIPHNIEPQD